MVPVTLIRVVFCTASSSMCVSAMRLLLMLCCAALCAGEALVAAVVVWLLRAAAGTRCVPSARGACVAAVQKLMDDLCETFLLSVLFFFLVKKVGSGVFGIACRRCFCGDGD